MRTLNWSSIIRPRYSHGVRVFPTRILVGRSSYKDYGAMVTVYWDDPDCIGSIPFASRDLLRGELSKRFPGTPCNWFGRLCSIPERGELWPDQESEETFASDGDGPWQRWPRRDVTTAPDPTEWRPCLFCGAMIVGGWKFPRYKDDPDAACHDHIVRREDMSTPTPTSLSRQRLVAAILTEKWLTHRKKCTQCRGALSNARLCPIGRELIPKVAPSR